MPTTQFTIEWRPIKGFPAYEVSNQGEVRRVGTLRPLRPNNDRYPLVVLRRNGQNYPRRVHRLVAEAFLPGQPTSRHQVNHIDGVKTHNQAANLEWCTDRENKQHAIRSGLHRRGIRGPNIGYKMAREIHAAFAAGLNRSQIARQLNIHRSMVSRILSGRSYAGSKDS
jgi:DNA-binding NarL/FixJ family response regulator